MKTRIIIPMSGFGERFRAAGYKTPKPLIPVLGRPIIAHILDMFPGETNFLFICNREHLDNPAWEMRQTLERLAPRGQIVGIEPHKLGPVWAVAQALDFIDPQDPVLVNYCDFSCRWDWEAFKNLARKTNCQGAVACYKGFHPHMLGSTNYAYVQCQGDRVTNIQEKKAFTDAPMNEYASSGSYYFGGGEIMARAFQQTLRRDDLTVGGEYYVSLAYAPMLEAGLDVRVFELEKFRQWGTPRDLEEYLYHAAIHRPNRQRQIRPKQPGTVLLPMAGLGTRFAKEGYRDPKPLIEVDGSPMFLRALADLPRADKTVFVIRGDMAGAAQVISLAEKEPGAVVKCLSRPTEGQAVTCLAAEELIEPDLPLTIGACDNGYIYDVARFETLLADAKIDFWVWAQKAYPPGARHPEMYGWLQADEAGKLLKVSVKKSIGQPDRDPVVTGGFTFRRAADFFAAVRRLMARNGRINGEFYVDECCNDALDMGLRGQVFFVNSWIGWGTPDELRTYEYWREDMKP
jgi:NDP-sugar pyrophosphorylase family protein